MAAAGCRNTASVFFIGFGKKSVFMSFDNCDYDRTSCCHICTLTDRHRSLALARISFENCSSLVTPWLRHRESEFKFGKFSTIARSVSRASSLMATPSRQNSFIIVFFGSAAANAPRVSSLIALSDTDNFVSSCDFSITRDAQECGSNQHGREQCVVRGSKRN